MRARLLAILLAALIITGACASCGPSPRPGAVSARGVPAIFAATLVIRDMVQEHAAGRPVCGAVRVAPRVAVTAHHCVVASSHTPVEWMLAKELMKRTKEPPEVTGRMVWISTYADWEEANGAWREMNVTPAFINGWDSVADVAVLILSDPGPFVKVRRGVPRRGEPIQAIHHTANLLYSFSAGAVSAMRNANAEGRTYRLLQLDLAVSSGASGSGAFDSQDRLIGIGSKVMFSGGKRGKGGPLGIAFYAPVVEFAGLVERAIRSGG